MNRGQRKVARKAVADSRNDAGIKRQRTLLRTYLTYHVAADQMQRMWQQAGGATLPDTTTFAVRKNRDGFGVYRREVVK